MKSQVIYTMSQSYRKVLQFFGTMIFWLCIMIAFDWIFFVTVKPASGASNIYGRPNMDHKVYFIGMTLLTFILLCSLGYKRLFSFKKPVDLLFFAFFAFSASIFIGLRLRDITVLYDYEFVHGNRNRLSWDVHYFDKRNNWRAKPNSHGFFEYGIGDSIQGRIPIYYDSLGSRTVSDELRVDSDTMDLFIGCSFTHGAYIRAEEGFPYLVTRRLGHSLMNIGMSSYGMAQMMDRLDSALSERRFKYVFIQMSDWLSQRSMQLNGLYNKSYPPVTYFTGGKGDYSIAPIAYRHPDYGGLRSWAGMKRTYSNRLHFMRTKGFQVEVVSYLRYKVAQIKSHLGIVPKPASDKLDLEKYFYDRVIENVRKAGAIPVLYKIYWRDKDVEPLRRYLEDKAIYADCDRIEDSVTARNLRSDKKYFWISHLHKGQKIYYDNHPNATANALFAENILKALGR